MAQDAGVGFIGALIAVMCFGTYAVPTKFIETGDGMMFQWIECSAIWVVGLIIMFIEGSYEFHPLAVLGGVLWCLGNSSVVPIVNWIGLGMGMLVWGLANMLIGWACGHFGWFIGSVDKIPNPVLNYIGLALALFSVVFYFPVKTTVKRVSTAAQSVNDPTHFDFTPLEESTKPETPLTSKIFGLSGSLMAGIFYGFNMIPVAYLTGRPGADPEPLHYVFSHFTGIFLCSTALVALYAGVKQNQVWFNSKMVLPALLAGILWAVAQSAWFVANRNLGLSVSFPIITTGPGVVASLIGIIFFKEIQGRRNFAYLSTAFLLTLSGVICIGLSSK